MVNEWNKVWESVEVINGECKVKVLEWKGLTVVGQQSYLLISVTAFLYRNHVSYLQIVVLVIRY